MQCTACGRRIFSTGLRSCPACHASLAGLDAHDPAYADELLQPEATEPPPDVEPAGEEAPSPAEVPRVVLRGLAAGGVVLALLLLAPFASDGLAWVRAERARRALVEVERQQAEEQAASDQRWCAAACPAGVYKVNIDGDCTGIEVGRAKRAIEQHHCNCGVQPTSRFAWQGS